MLKKIFAKKAAVKEMETQLFPDSDWLEHYTSFLATKKWTGGWDIYECLYLPQGKRLAYTSLARDVKIASASIELPLLAKDGNAPFFQVKIKRAIGHAKNMEGAKAFLDEREQELATCIVKGRMKEIAVQKVAQPHTAYFKNTP